MRLIDLQCNWALQYTGESTQYDPALYASVASRLDQVEAYLSGVSAAILACGRSPEDWSRQESPWSTLDAMIARYHAEFPGRLLMGPNDSIRWLAEPRDSMCWGVLAVAGLDYLVRSSSDLERLAGLWARGVRIFQLVASRFSPLGGADRMDEDRGLTDLGHDTLDCLANLENPRLTTAAAPAIDLAELGPRATADVLDWFESEPSRRERLLLLRSHGSIRTSSQPAASGLEPESLKRLRALGGFVGLSVGPPHVLSPSELREQIEAVASCPLGSGQAGYEGIGLASNFLEIPEPLDQLSNPERLVHWLRGEFNEPARSALGFRSARMFLSRLIGEATAGTDAIPHNLAES